MLAARFNGLGTNSASSFCRYIYLFYSFVPNVTQQFRFLVEHGARIHTLFGRKSKPKQVLTFIWLHELILNVPALPAENARRLFAR